MSNDEVEKSIAALKGVLQTIGTAARSDNTILNCSIYSALTRVIQYTDALPTSTSIEKVIISDSSITLIINLYYHPSEFKFIDRFIANIGGPLLRKKWSSFH